MVRVWIDNECFTIKVDVEDFLDDYQYNRYYKRPIGPYLTYSIPPRELYFIPSKIKMFEGKRRKVEEPSPEISTTPIPTQSTSKMSFRERLSRWWDSTEEESGSDQTTTK